MSWRKLSAVKTVDYNDNQHYFRTDVQFLSKLSCKNGIYWNESKKNKQQLPPDLEKRTLIYI